MSFLDNLYYGNISPYKHERKSPQIVQAEELTARNDNHLASMLSREQKDIYERFKACVYEENDLLRLQSFKEGFCLGMRMAFEAMCGAECATTD